MERELFTKLERWMNKKNRKPLIIQGARQVGKTWIMKEFGARFYENTVYINFDNNKAMKDVFDLDFDLKRILSAIKIEYGKSFQAENTLIIFDEIQEAPKALASLKYFYENAPQYSIIAAGSLLGCVFHSMIQPLQNLMKRTAHLFAGDLHQPKPRHIHQDRFDRISG